MNNPSATYPVKVLQFGEGCFLRGFVDWMLHRMNEQGVFQGQAVVVQPIAEGLVHLLNEQNGAYTLLLRGIQEGRIVEQSEWITSIQKGINPYTDYDELLECAANPDLRVIVSNTTEAGIVYSEQDRYDDKPPASFPGKLTVILHKRFEAFGGDPDKALILLPCELIERNGSTLKDIVKQHARRWGLPSEFMQWLEANPFLNTLVDRIVTGYPKEELGALAKKFGYIDRLLNTAEPFHQWIIEGDRSLEAELPFAEAGLNVVWTNDLTPYRTRKVRILNGAHTMTALAAYLAGADTVMQCMDDGTICSFMRKGLQEEIIPTLDMPRDELREYTDSVLERFSNPFIKHYLLSISLNSLSKFKTRVLPSLTAYAERYQTVPELLAFSLAALIRFYRGRTTDDGRFLGDRDGREYLIQDDPAVLCQWENIWRAYDGTPETVRSVVEPILSDEGLWGTRLCDIKGLEETVSKHLSAILADGMRQAMKQAVRGA